MMVVAGVGICLVLFDFWLPRERVRVRLLLGGAAFVVALACLATLAWAAAGELLPPPKVPGQKQSTPLGGSPQIMAVAALGVV